MKIKYLFQILFLAILMTSCSRDGDSKIDEDNEPLLTNLKTGFLYPDLWIINRAEINFIFAYDRQKRVTKKNGGFLSISGSTGFNAMFTDKISTSIIYQNDKVTVEDFYNSTEFTIPKNTKYFTLNAQNQISKKQSAGINIYWYKNDSYFYKNGQLDEIITALPNMIYDPGNPEDKILTYREKFYYDANGNLAKTEYFEQLAGVDQQKERIRFFQNYDNSPNPFKKLTLLEEYFYRSLSKNNFASYKEYDYQNGKEVLKSAVDWTFNYDAAGNIIVN
ncbi:hypothetical protein IV494_09455 [Kaistella sp. G5-32]|uniref:YD repeat-containing protein n=1 Tax=Kaistella gelatinilytica TaxID=2787636 RepID=A0ABS0FCH1_9FLAO|nr:hypothetical protein [Kaistella gelatinilytica]MBF8457404.1 hypothetical protein [Kaistella gelatinilytica]